MDGPLKREACDSLNDLTARHESLRTIFPEGKVCPSQFILDSSVERPPLQVEQASKSGLAAAVEKARAIASICGESLRCGHGSSGWTIGSTFCCYLVHHIAADGWSLAPLARDLHKAYAARIDGENPIFPALPVQYGGLHAVAVELLVKRLTKERNRAAAGIFAEGPCRLPEELDLPRDRPRPQVSSYHGEVLTFTINTLVHQQLTRAGARGARKPVHGVYRLRCCTAHAAGSGHRYCARQPNRRTY